LSVLNSLAANRRLAYRMVAVQAVVAMLVAPGSLVLALRSLPTTQKSAGWSMSRMVSGLMLKWFVAAATLGGDFA
jgi:hypothetical protein